jgi:hypothetical protein
MRAFLCPFALTAALLGGFCARAQMAREYVLELTPETAADRAWRHEQVAGRRRGPVVMVHRGASAAAPENSLQAYATAMDWGADGLEVDIRRTRDGVLALFHDDMLDRLTHGIGEVSQLTASKLLALKPRLAFGRPAGGTPPSFVQLLDLVRQRAALLHLDVKEPGLEDDLIRWLDAADVWDHVVAVSEANAPRLARDPRVKPLRYKAPGLYAGRRDVDPEAVRAALRLPGEMILVDDPRVAAWVLERPNYRPVPLLRTYRLVPKRREAPAPAGAPFNPAALVADLQRTVPPDSALALLGLLQAPFPEADDLRPDPAVQARRAARIVERAWAADQLGQLGRRHRDITRALERLVRGRTPHPDWRYHALDGALAARALGSLGVMASAEVLIEAFRARPVELPEPETADAQPAAWADARFKLHLLPALADLRCGAAKRFLRECLALDEAAARAFGPPLFEDATRALLQQHLSAREIAELLGHPNPAVRGTAILECLDRPNAERRRALGPVAPWALALPAAPALSPAPERPRPLTRAGVVAPPKGSP